MCNDIGSQNFLNCTCVGVCICMFLSNILCIETRLIDSYTQNKIICSKKTVFRSLSLSCPLCMIPSYALERRPRSCQGCNMMVFTSESNHIGHKFGFCQLQPFIISLSFVRAQSPVCGIRK